MRWTISGGRCVQVEQRDSEPRSIDEQMAPFAIHPMHDRCAAAITPKPQHTVLGQVCVTCCYLSIYTTWANSIDKLACDKGFILFGVQGNPCSISYIPGTVTRLRLPSGHLPDANRKPTALTFFIIINTCSPVYTGSEHKFSMHIVMANIDQKTLAVITSHFKYLN